MKTPIHRLVTPYSLAKKLYNIKVKIKKTLFYWLKSPVNGTEELVTMLEKDRGTFTEDCYIYAPTLPELLAVLNGDYCGFERDKGYIHCEIIEGIYVYKGIGTDMIASVVDLLLKIK